VTTDQRDQQTTETDKAVAWLAGIGVILTFGGAIAYLSTLISSQQCLAGQISSPCDSDVYWHAVGAGAFIVGAMMLVGAFLVGAIRDH
jgi:hypothetical protein